MSVNALLNRAFTVVELAVVLVIIGLIVGGVVVGQNLVRASELNSVLTDVDKFKSALTLFEQKYNALPGDMTNATSYWGTDPNGCPGGTLGSTTKTNATCNGDNNGTIGNYVTMVNAYEFYRAWQHLAAAGMVPGSFSGTAGSTGYYHTIIDVNVPASRILGGGYTLVYFGYYAGNADWFPADYGHTAFFGAAWPNSQTFAPLLTTEEADSIDTKMDDGRPGTGHVMAFKSTTGITPGCVTTAVASTAAYAVSSSGRLCSLFFTKLALSDTQ